MLAMNAVTSQCRLLHRKSSVVLLDSPFTPRQAYEQNASLLRSLGSVGSGHDGRISRLV
jgi:hypothetical protein